MRAFGCGIAEAISFLHKLAEYLALAKKGPAFLMIGRALLFAKG